MSTGRFDVILVGGGIMGCAIAYALLVRDPSLAVAVVERDPTYERSSTVLSDGNIRVQFNLDENILMSKYGLEVLETFADDMAVDGDRPDVAFRQQGNLFLVDEAGEEEARAGLARQRALGCEVEWLEPEQIRDHFPLYNLEGCIGGTLGHRDGTMSPVAFLHAYRRKAISLGATFVEGEVDTVTREGSRVTGVRLASGGVLAAPHVVNAAGAWASVVARSVGVELPIEPVKRQVTVFRTYARLTRILPALFFPSGLYLIHEGEGVYMSGKSFPDDPVAFDDFTWERSTFEARLWPELVRYIPSFDELRVTGGWAGLYEVNTLDGNAILGEWPGLDGFWLANGFSGHGFQQAPAVGRHLAEQILGLPPSLDLARFGPRRILDGTPVPESARRII